MDPPCQMQEARQRLQMAPHIREQHLELLVAVGARKSHTLHALVNRHGMTLSVVRAAAALSAAHFTVRPPQHLLSRRPIFTAAAACGQDVPASR